MACTECTARLKKTFRMFGCDMTLYTPSLSTFKCYLKHKAILDGKLESASGGPTRLGQLKDGRHRQAIWYLSGARLYSRHPCWREEY